MGAEAAPWRAGSSLKLAEPRRVGESSMSAASSRSHGADGGVLNSWRPELLRFETVSGVMV
jgi:hypothetical protein